MDFLSEQFNKLPLSVQFIAGILLALISLGLFMAFWSIVLGLVVTTITAITKSLKYCLTVPFYFFWGISKKISYKTDKRVRDLKHYFDNIGSKSNIKISNNTIVENELIDLDSHTIFDEDLDLEGIKKSSIIVDNIENESFAHSYKENNRQKSTFKRDIDVRNKKLSSKTNYLKCDGYYCIKVNRSCTNNLKFNMNNPKCVSCLHLEAGNTAEKFFQSHARAEGFYMEPLVQDKESYEEGWKKILPNKVAIKRGDYICRNCRNIEIEVKCLTPQFLNGRKYYRLAYNDLKRHRVMEKESQTPVVLALYEQKDFAHIKNSIRMIKLSDLFKGEHVDAGLQDHFYDSSRKITTIWVDKLVPDFDLLRKIKKELYP